MLIIANGSQIESAWYAQSKFEIRITNQKKKQFELIGEKSKTISILNL